MCLLGAPLPAVFSIGLATRANQRHQQPRAELQAT